MINIFRNKAIAISASNHAIIKMHAAAIRTKSTEVGGLLIGWWNGETAMIEDIAEVLDPHATVNSWTRNESRSQEILNGVLEGAKDLNLGYIGDWHSHPSVIGASGPDLASLKRASRQFSYPLTLIIRLPDNTLEFHSALKGRLRRVTIQEV